MIILVLECSGNADCLDMALLSNQFCSFCDMGVSEIRIKKSFPVELKELIWHYCARYDYYVNVVDDLDNHFDLEACLFKCEHVLLIDWHNSDTCEALARQIEEYGVPVSKLIAPIVSDNQNLITDYFDRIV